MKKTLAPTFFLLISLAISAPAVMAANGDGGSPSSPRGMITKPLSGGKALGVQRGEKTYLRSFDGTYLRTTAGTIYMPPVKLVNHSGEDLRKVDGAKHKMEVKLTVVDRTVKQVDVYPEGGK